MESTVIGANGRFGLLHGLCGRTGIPFSQPMFAMIFCMAATSALGQSSGAYNIAVLDDARYRVGFEDLTASELPIPSGQLRLSHRGLPIDIDVFDGGDGRFGPGDYFHFTGRRLRGDHSWFDPYSAYNVYQLTTEISRPAAVVGKKPSPSVPIIEHLEKELMRVALPRATEPAALEPWYWQRISQVKGDHFSYRLSWSAPPRRLRVALAGLTDDQNATVAGVPQHWLQVYLAGRLVAQSSWEGQEPEIVVIDDLQLEETDASGALLELRIPQRIDPKTGRQLVDAALLNWIELEYPAGDDHQHTILDRSASHRLRVPEGVLSPERVIPVSPQPDLKSPSLQADYLMIVHSTLRTSLEPLAEFHRNRGRTVVVADVEAIFDQFNNGIHAPDALRRFVQYARSHWQKPAPAMLLLVGDASWERATPTGNSRNLVPTEQVMVQGHFAASDNRLVSVEGDDYLPDLAVGRLPAGSPEELDRMVNKVIAHGSRASATDKSLQAVWIAGEDRSFQKITDALARQAEIKGAINTRIYPAENQGQNEVFAALNGDADVVHFLGHGGRFVWRTGPPDLRTAADLFSVESLTDLDAKKDLPLVLSMTCSSGPFDHPNANSLAEVFLTAENRGAFAVVAASWRVVPVHAFSERLLRFLLIPGTPIGTALMKAKRAERHRSLVESYNLLGDPAMPLRFGTSHE